MRITLCAYDGPGYFGGPLEWYKRLGPALRGVGIETDFLFVTDGAPQRCGTYLRLKQDGFHCSALRRHSLTQWRDNTEARVRWILRQLRRRRPDLFVANLSVPGCFAARWAREAGIPSVCVIHSDDDFYRGIEEEFCVRPGPFRLSGAVCVSRLLEDEVRSRVGGENFTAVRIPCGTPIPVERVSDPVGVLRLCYVGRLTEKAKRVAALTRAFCRAVREIPGTEAVLFGDGPARPAVEESVRSSGCNTLVRLAGQVDGSRVQEELLKCHIIVLLSDYEGLPMALMEGMACGLVPVCLDIRSGIPELVEHGKTGLLVRDRGDDFVAAIRRLREEVGLWDLLSRAAREKVEREYSMRVVAKEWRQLIEGIGTQGCSTHAIVIPRRMELPPVNDRLRGDDRRWDRCGGYVGRQVRRVVRRLLGTDR